MSNEDSAILSAHWMLFAFLIASQISKSQGKALAFGAIIQVTLSALISETPQPTPPPHTHTDTLTLPIRKALSHPLDLKRSTSRAQVPFCMHSHYWVDKIASLQRGVWWRPGVKWMAHSLSVLQMNAPRKASRTAKVHSKPPPAHPLLQCLLHAGQLIIFLYRQSSALLNTMPTSFYYTFDCSLKTVQFNPYKSQWSQSSLLDY